MYKVTIDSTHAEAMENPNNWPSHVEVNFTFLIVKVKLMLQKQVLHIVNNGYCNI